MKELLWIGNYLADASKHFGLAFCAGFLGFYLTSTIFCVFSWVWETLTRKKVNTVVGYCMVILSVLAGLALALLSHAWLDGFSIWWVKPLVDSSPNF